MKVNSYCKKTVVVLGPPRSGTSLTAGLLSILGVDMGNVRDPDFENPKGYFEDKDFLTLTNEIFESADPNSDGFNPPSIKKILAQKNIFSEKIKALVQNRSSNSKSLIWGWKTTGTSLTIPLFLPYLTNPYFVVVLRNPLDIAKSAVSYAKSKSYKEISLLKALEVTNVYYNSIYSFLDEQLNLPMSFVSYERIISNPLIESKKLADFLGLKPAQSQFKKFKNFVLSRKKVKRAKRKAKLKHIAKKYLGRVVSKTH